MKVLSIPSSGKLANTVAYISPFGQVYRTRAVPRNTPSAARDHMRGSFGRLSRMWGRVLSQEQRDRWSVAGPQVMSHPRLGRGPLSGQQHFQGINSARACIGLGPLLEPPQPVVFGPSPVAELVITNDEGGARLYVRVNGPVEEDIMVFGQAPCSAGRSKRRNVSYLGLMGPAVGGLSEITPLYKARFGEPRPGTKLFIVTCQQKDGWEGARHVVSEIVPERREGLHELNELHGLHGVGAVGGAAGAAGSTSGPENSQKNLMHKGCTRDAEGTKKLPGSGGGGGCEGNPKGEIRSPKEGRSSKSETGEGAGGG